MSSFMMAMPAAPAPLVTTLTSSIFLPTTFSALIRRGQRHDGGAVLIVVENRGCRSISFSRRSISKQRGAEMSSRLMPPKLPESR